MDPESVANLSELPMDIIIYILESLQLNDLKNASMVCKSWYNALIVGSKQINRKFILQPTENSLSTIYNSNRRYFLLRIKNFIFDKPDSYYFESFEKLCPFVVELQIIDSDLKIHHLLKLLELTTCLEVFSLNGCSQLLQAPSLFPFDYDCIAKNRVLANLQNINKLIFNIIFYTMNDSNKSLLIQDLVQCTSNLESLTISTEFSSKILNEDDCKEFCRVIGRTSESELTDLNWNLGDYVTNLIKNRNLKSFSFTFNPNLADPINPTCPYSAIYFQKRVEFSIIGLRYRHILLICKQLVNLKCLECHLLVNDPGVSQVANLKQLEVLRIKFTSDYRIRVAGGYGHATEYRNFLNTKFEFLRILELVAGNKSNLLTLCENHPNLIELKLLLEYRNLEPIFKYLTKLRILSVDFRRLSGMEMCGKIDSLYYDPDIRYEYNISRLQDLEEFYLGIQLPVSGIHEDEVNQLTKLKQTNISILFDNVRRQEGLYKRKIVKKKCLP